ncbi:hypothetical protein A3C21_02950 [Candidatus Kaiserbacteria bacterium RIFCSPHIGHO2_02_FULL_59_21]|uniref:Uncharacterized protein n=1 Tax=Candidatus Kaiserbacteria bacterium RIFCSPHIGHO2_02_FULL_59_21 TaxID=1798500 RepID=A0A1F6E067_9BACT|nr:MAG: hypothetical protein A2766_03990 [Candidatus Kaiserbacteria bacterium RIFCSPHIGHO2_01_FULL_58_22]OGG66622.1 MAG: hypothetical protein A3C21_02950 [Candidatus Kaiserbacteria bacterium RIFCSPHIGHO2_02_FULL_59_21]OGG79003.1 MAG: hypothetical protein A2952_01405 [Candidatus Kaiserbacteria bacterium RIFCSPLOWO2_01_FULL_59_34]OGG84373.1 MAG: hypothetical protein A3I47_01800 [Candidatus Kaiserbacteria bacterium RIFCSPLOWO2_02_FULL_59_19]
MGHAHARNLWDEVRGPLALALILFGFLLIASFAGASGRDVFTSSEVRFADASPGGLSIVPASCPSSPHSPGKCDEPPQSETFDCNITASPYRISQGQSSTLSWQGGPGSSSGTIISRIVYVDGHIEPGIGSVPESGSVSVSPQTTTNYRYTATQQYVVLGIPGSSATVHCDATVTVEQCPAGQFAYNGQCVSQCPSGWTLQNGQCVATSCPAGYTLQNGACVFTNCPSGYIRQGNQCVLSECPAGYTLRNGACVFTNCPSGHERRNDQCVIEQDTCQLVCSGKNLVNSCTGQVVRACAYQCSAGACVAAPPPSAALTAHPLLVRSGDATTIRWSAQNVDSCTVTGSNGDSWTSEGDGAFSQTSSPLVSETIYTLSCMALDGSDIARSLRIVIVPTFEEQ